MLLVPGDLRAADPKRVSSLCNIAYPSDAGLEWQCRRLRTGETLEGLFGDRWRDVARFNRVDRRHARPGRALKVPQRLEEIADFTPLPANYPSAEQEAKFILVDLSKQFLGAYEYGRLVFSAPITSGEPEDATPTGEFKVTAMDRGHRSSLYRIEDTEIAYPMNYALRFHVTREGVGYWIHGRDLPGYPASHGCIGLYDEAMQQEYYGYPKNPALEDARTLYDWVAGSLPEGVPEGGGVRDLPEGPRVLIVGQAPE